MEIILADDKRMYFIRHDDGGKMLKLFRDNELKCEYSHIHREYTFYNKMAYQTALLLI